MIKTDLSAKSNRSHALAQLQNDGVQAPDLLTSPADLLTSSDLPRNSSMNTTRFYQQICLRHPPDLLTSFDDVMLYVGIEVADVSFAAGSLARIVLCFGSWRQQRLRGFQQESAIGFRNGVVLRNQSMRKEDATSFELVATPRIDVAAGSSRGRGSLIVENTSTVAPASFVGGNALLLVAAVKSFINSKTWSSLWIISSHT
ncbi:hypothetical protein F511_39224 [Dorcoceras hygrometricum]|uniref:Uncharacterized protein n=1 Tax=Dorcoceras hygrometricum TaxID=472368 RepID=A0A2Z7A8M0_9LAMI|nr:hypothetical protein F511_39224 [Dorcoceras hygrometricum]